jgi:hypothetical protein
MVIIIVSSLANSAIIGIHAMLPQLDGIGSQHREAQGEESKKFKSYFDKIVILPGGYVIINNDAHVADAVCTLV